MAGIISGKEIEIPEEIKDILEFGEEVILAFQETGLSRRTAENQDEKYKRSNSNG